MVVPRFGVLMRIVTIGLLLWAATDLAFPGLCAEDAGITSQAGSSPADRGSSQQDDCFCCCHHVVPTNFDLVTAFLFSIDVPDTQATGLSPGIPRAFFHPPLAL